MDVSFYVPPGELIPTQFRLMCDGKIVVYEKDWNLGTYKLWFQGLWTSKEEETAIKNIAKLIEQQSDNGETRLFFKESKQILPNTFEISFKEYNIINITDDMEIKDEEQWGDKDIIKELTYYGNNIKATKYWQDDIDARYFRYLMRKAAKMLNSNSLNRKTE